MGSKNTKDFKRDALRMRERTGVSVTAEKLGVSVKLLYIWRREERLERGEASKVLRPGETAKQGCKRLERENEELREANYILKKAMGLMKERLTEAIAKALTPIQAQRIRAVYIVSFGF